MQRASIALAGSIALSCLVVSAQPSFADEASGRQSFVEAATNTARVFAQASALASRAADERTTNPQLLRFAAAEADADTRALQQLERNLGQERVAANEQADFVRTGRSVATDRPPVAQTPSFADDLPAIVVGLRQLSAGRNGSFDRSYKNFEKPLLRQLAVAFAAIGRTAEDPAARATAQAEASRLQAAQTELDAL